MAASSAIRKNFSTKKRNSNGRSPPASKAPSRAGSTREKSSTQNRSSSKDNFRTKDKGDSKKKPRLKQTPSLAKDLDAIQNLDPIETYHGRDRYLGHHGASSFDEPMLSPSLSKENPLLSSADLQLLTEEGAFTLPSNPVQHELIATFMEFGHVWTPIIDPAWLTGTKPSFLLLQAIFVAASRITTQPNEYGLTSDFYRRAKLLFCFGFERDPLISITSAVLLHWYNPVGPETLSTDTSGFWLRTAETIAFQIGLHKEPSAKDHQRALRRRIWWTLVLRDCSISAAVGRPRTINLSDSDVLPPSLDDFLEPDAHARIFPVSVSICQRLGDIVERCLRGELTPDHQRSLEDALFRWVKQDFPSIAGPFPGYSMEARQVLVTYLASLIVLDRSPAADEALSTRSLLAASFIAGLFREFLERDELCRLGGAFTFYALTAGLMLIPGGRIEGLRDLVNEDTIMLKASLHILSRQWRSASGALRALQTLQKDCPRKRSPVDTSRLTEEIQPFLAGLDTKWCRLWAPLVENDHERPVSSLKGSQRSVLEPYVNAQAHALDLPPLPVEYHGELGVITKDWEGGGFDLGGSWLLDSDPFPSKS
ncbi:hypothetical protein BJX76DRAFT_359048 [Aspergillus varians]